MVDKAVVADADVDEIPRLLLRIARTQEKAWCEALRKAIPNARRKYNLPLPAYTDEDYRQLSRGYLSVFEETVLKTGTTRRDAYIGSVVEGLAKGGIPYTYVVHVAVGSQAGLMVGWVAEVPDEQRPAAVEWLMAYFADYVADMIHTGIRLAARA